MIEDEQLNKQIVFIDLMLSEPSLYTRVVSIYNAENFQPSLRKCARFLADYYNQYSAIPSVEQINIKSLNTKFEKIDPVTDDQIEWFLNEFESFTRKEELERAILKSAEMISKGEYDPVEKMIKDAVSISLTRDLGIDYFSDPRKRLLHLKDSNGQISTGWASMDEKLYGGVNRGELNIVCGSSGSGKSLFLQNIALNWIQNGLNGVYITLELSEELVAKRIDSMLTGVGAKEIYKNLDDVEIKVSLAGKKSGSLQIKYLPAQSTVNQIKAYIKELSIKHNKSFDFMCLDYVDLIMPSSQKVDIGNVFLKDKLVCEELRTYAMSLKSLLATASQLNRNAFEEIEISGSSIAGGISKLNTADNLFAIYMTKSMRDRGVLQVQFLKTRSSAGVGNKIDLTYNVRSLRITDEEESRDAAEIVSGAKMLEKIRSMNGRKNTPSDDAQSPPNVEKKDEMDVLLKKLSGI